MLALTEPEVEDKAMADRLNSYDIARLAARDLVLGGDLPGHLVEDVEQDAILWVLEHQRDVENSKMPDGTYNVQQLSNKIRRALLPAVEAERSHMYGANRPYVSRYDRDTVEAVLPHILDPESTPPRQEGEGGGPSAVDPAKYSKWTVMRADVAAAMKKMDDAPRGLLAAHYIMGMTWDSVAFMLDRPKTSVYRRGQEAMEELLAQLNGEVPADPVQRRRAISNARARAITDQDYGGQPS